MTSLAFKLAVGLYGGGGQSVEDILTGLLFRHTFDSDTPETGTQTKSETARSVTGGALVGNSADNTDYRSTQQIDTANGGAFGATVIHPATQDNPVYIGTDFSSDDPIPDGYALRFIAGVLSIRDTGTNSGDILSGLGSNTYRWAVIVRDGNGMARVYRNEQLVWVSESVVSVSDPRYTTIGRTATGMNVEYWSYANLTSGIADGSDADYYDAAPANNDTFTHSTSFWLHVKNTFTTQSSDDRINFRRIDGDNCVRLRLVSNGQYKVEARESGSNTMIVETSTGYASSGDAIDIKVDGNSYTLYVNGTQIGTGTNSYNASETGGRLHMDGGNTFTNLTLTPLAASGDELREIKALNGVTS